MQTSKKKYIVSIVYVILLSLGPLFSIVWLMVSGDLTELFSESTSSDPFANATGDVSVIFGPILLYMIACAVLGIVDIIRSFRAFRAGLEDVCLMSMLIHKYGLVVFFIMNFILCALVITGGAMVAIFATRGAGIIFSPIFFIMALCASIFSYLAILPGSFYGIQTIRFARLRGFTTQTMAVVHGIFQFLFLCDVLDAMYLSVSKWGRAKVMAIIVGLVYLLVVIAIVSCFLILVLTVLFSPALIL